MPQTKEYTVYTFEELSGAAKEKAREWFRAGNVDDNYWTESIYEDAANIGAILGIDLLQRRGQTLGGATTYSPAIYWSGFWSQGDGACFECRYAYAKGWKQKLEAEIGGDTLPVMVDIGQRLQALQARNFYRIEATTKQSGHYNHEYSMDIDGNVGDSYSFPAVVHDELKEIFADFARWIYSSLETEYWYQQSDEVVDENIQANEYTFDEYGNREN